MMWQAEMHKGLCVTYSKCNPKVIIRRDPFDDFLADCKYSPNLRVSDDLKAIRKANRSPSSSASTDSFPYSIEEYDSDSSFELFVPKNRLKGKGRNKENVPLNYSSKTTLTKIDAKERAHRLHFTNSRKTKTKGTARKNQRGKSSFTNEPCSRELFPILPLIKDTLEKNSKAYEPETSFPYNSLPTLIKNTKNALDSEHCVHELPNTCILKPNHQAKLCFSTPVNTKPDDLPVNSALNASAISFKSSPITFKDAPAYSKPSENVTKSGFFGSCHQTYISKTREIQNKSQIVSTEDVPRRRSSSLITPLTISIQPQKTSQPLCNLSVNKSMLRSKKPNCTTKLPSSEKFHSTIRQPYVSNTRKLRRNSQLVSDANSLPRMFASTFSTSRRSSSLISPLTISIPLQRI